MPYQFELLLGAPTVPPSGSPYIYYSRASDLIRTAIVTGTVEPILLPNGFAGGEHVAADEVRGKLYILDYFERIVQVNPDGSNPLVVVADTDPNDRIRFAISETARLEVLRRLAELNRQRYEEEVARGLHGAKTTGSATRAPRNMRTGGGASSQPSFDFDASPVNEGNYLKAAELRPQYQADPVHAVVEYLKTHSGWHAKSDIVSAIDITDGQWSAAIAELIADNRIERQGEKRGARYRVVTEGAK